MIRSLLLSFMIFNVGALQLNNNFGKKRWFHPNRKCPADDLKVISLAEASLITRYWLTNIMVDNIIHEEDQVLVDKINKAEQYFQNQFSELSKYNDLYLAWVPKGNVKEIVFIIISNVDHDNRKLVVNMLIPNPYWDSSQISTNELKKALICLTNETDATLDLDLVYKNDLRIKLDWTMN